MMSKLPYREVSVRVDVTVDEVDVTVVVGIVVAAMPEAIMIMHARRSREGPEKVGTERPRREFEFETHFFVVKRGS